MTVNAPNSFTTIMEKIVSKDKVRASRCGCEHFIALAFPGASTKLIVPFALFSFRTVAEAAPRMSLLLLVGAGQDFRYMAISDLQRELQSDSVKLDDFTERKLCENMLKLLEDQSVDVSGLAVKWYGIGLRSLDLLRCNSGILTHVWMCSLPSLILRVQPIHAEMMLTQLCEKLIADNSKDRERETASIALKTLIQEIKAPPVKAHFVEVVTPHLLKGLVNDKKV